MNQSLETLNNRFGLPGRLNFLKGEGDFPVADIQTSQASARVCLYGAHVLAWQPAGQNPVIWLSKAAIFEAGKPIRGGVPVCWPWFGPREGLPAHGFVRTLMWTVRATSVDEAGDVVLRLGTVDNAATRALWDHAFDLEMVLTVGKTLSMTLLTCNTGTLPFTLNQALHTYFAIGDIAQTTVHGLDGCTYLDKVQNAALVKQTGPVTITAETDRVYADTTADCVIDDKAWGRSIRVAKEGSTSTVVWNPWSEREKAIVDMAGGEFHGMLCVETCNAGADQVTLAPGQQHGLTARITVL